MNHTTTVISSANEITGRATTKKLYIRNMVSLRCIMAVQTLIDKLGFHYKNVELGEADLVKDITEEQRQVLKSELSKIGLELIHDRRNILIEKIKILILDMIHYAESLPQVKFSVYISEKLHYDYNYLANVFSKITGITIEHYIINHKIEKVKELILEDEMNLTQISYKLNYSSVAHLSTQFKKTTGITPSFFKQTQHCEKRIPLDTL